MLAIARYHPIVTPVQNFPGCIFIMLQDVLIVEETYCLIVKPASCVDRPVCNREPVRAYL